MDRLRRSPVFPLGTTAVSKCVAGLVLAALVFMPATSPAQQVRKRFPVPDFGVSSLAVLGDTLLLGGDFTRLAPWGGAGIPVDPVTGAEWLEFPRFEGSADAVVSDDAGGWFVALDQRRYTDSGLGTPVLVHILADGTIGSWGPALDGPIRTLLKVGSTLYCWGWFHAIDGESRAGFAAFDAVTGTLLSWQPDLPGSAHLMFNDGARIFATGNLDNAQRIVELDPLSGAARHFGPVYDQSIRSVHVANGRIYTQGDFTQVGATPRAGLAAIDLATGALLPWAPALPSAPTCMAGGSDALYCGGDFGQFGGADTVRLVALDFESGQRLPLATKVDDGPNQMICANGNLYVLGHFSHANGVERWQGAAFTLPGGALTDWDPRPMSGQMNRIAAGPQGLYLASYGLAVGSVPRTSVAMVNANTGAILDWNVAMDGPVHGKMQVSGNRLYVTGDFANVAGEASAGCAAIDIPTARCLPWHPTFGAGYERFYGAYPVRDRVFMVRSPGIGFAPVDTSTGATLPWPTNFMPDGNVNDVLELGDRLYLFGEFTHIGGLPRQNSAALRLEDWSLTDWNPAPDYLVTKAVAEGGRIFMGGYFSQIQGESRNHLAAVDATSGALLPFRLANPSYLTPYYFALTHEAGRLFAGGEPSWDSPSSAVTVFDDVSGARLSGYPSVGRFDSGIYVVALVLHGTTLFAGGSFDVVDGWARGSLVAIDFAVLDAPRSTPGTTLRPRFAPQPARSQGVLEFQVPASGPVTARLYDVAGRVVRTLLDRLPMAAGHQRVPVGLEGLRPGLYLCRLETAREAAVVRVLKVD